jgi:hypothetical protein
MGHAARDMGHAVRDTGRAARNTGRAARNNSKHIRSIRFITMAATGRVDADVKLRIQHQNRGFIAAIKK